MREGSSRPRAGSCSLAAPLQPVGCPEPGRLQSRNPWMTLAGPHRPSTEMSRLCVLASSSPVCCYYFVPSLLLLKTTPQMTCTCCNFGALWCLSRGIRQRKAAGIKASQVQGHCTQLFLFSLSFN